MKIRQRDGRTVISVNNREIIEHYSDGNRYETHYSDSGSVTKSMDTQYVHNDRGQIMRSFCSATGNVELFAYDPYGNHIGTYGVAGWSSSRYVLPFSYAVLKDGTVKGIPLSRIHVDTYEEWRDALPTDFEPEPCKEPVVVKDKPIVPLKYRVDPLMRWEDVAPYQSRYLSEIYERLQREQAEARLDTDRRADRQYVRYGYVPNNNPFDML